MAKTTEKYELMYIINPNLSEEETAAVVEKFKALVEQNGTLEEMEEMGKRKLAYEINYISRQVHQRPGFPGRAGSCAGHHGRYSPLPDHPSPGIRRHGNAEPHCAHGPSDP